MDDRSLAWLQIGRAAVAESVKRAVLEIFPDPVDALKADLSVLRHGNQCPYRRQALDSFVNRLACSGTSTGCPCPRALLSD